MYGYVQHKQEQDLHDHFSVSYGDWKIFCEKCGMQTGWTKNKEDAIEIWNRVMDASNINVGYKFDKDINVPDKERMAKVKNIQTDWHDDDYINYRLGEMYHFGDCDNCGETVTESQKYCSYCGAKLDWGKDE